MFFRVPGCEKKVVQIVVTAAQSNLSPDYDRKKLRAAKVLQHKPAGEPRTPNPGLVWSGLEFSSFIPESVIREKFHQEQIVARHAGYERTPIWGQGATDFF